MNESVYISEKSLKAMEQAFAPVKGSEILEAGAKVIQGSVNPEKFYKRGFYSWSGNNLFADAIIEMPNGARHSLYKR